MHDQKATAPGGLLTNPTHTGRTAMVRATAARYTRPRAGVPMDGETAPAAPPAPAGPAGGDPLGLGGAPAPTTPAPPPAGPPAPPPVVPQFVAPPPAPPPAPPAPGAPAVPPTPGQPGPGGAPAERPLDQFPEEIRSYIKELRKEAGDNRMAAKTAEEGAQAQLKGWLDGIAKTFGFITDAPAETTPEQQVQQLTSQMSNVQTDNRALSAELAIWKGAHEHGANPARLTNSRQFMNDVGKLDPSAPDFSTQLATAIGAATASDDYYKAAAAAPPVSQTPPVTPPLPPVPSGGEFAGGTGGIDTDPTTVDDFRAALKERAKTR